MGSENLKISIITVCYNAEKTIENTIRSVISQTYKYIEYIIIDGASTDGTLNIIKRYKDNIDVLVSEKDNGIYDAMNKGIKEASGDIIYFLNADDRFIKNDIVKIAASYFKQNPEIGILLGKVEFINKSRTADIYFDRFKFHPKNKIELLKKSQPQQCIFIRKSSFDNIGLFDTGYKICSDWDWLLRFYNSSLKISFTNEIFALYNCQGRSYENRNRIFFERIKTSFKNSNYFEFFLYLINAVIRTFNRFLNLNR